MPSDDYTKNVFRDVDTNHPVRVSWCEQSRRAMSCPRQEQDGVNSRESVDKVPKDGAVSLSFCACARVVCRANAAVRECLVESLLPATVLLLARHGKSRHLAAWSLASLAKSNAQLIDLSPARFDENERSYVVPDGGLRTGLCGQAVWLRTLSH